jgi:acyl carrier protein
MLHAEIYSTLTGVFHQVFARGDIVLTPDMTAKDIPGWNSFKQVEVILGVEESFAIRLDSQDIDRLENVGDLAAVVAAKLQQSSDHAGHV